MATPRAWLIVALFGIIAVATTMTYKPSSTPLLSLYLTIVWTLPVGMSMVVLVGAYKAARDIRISSQLATAKRINGQRLIIQLPTLGKASVIPSLARAIQSFEQFAPKYFKDWRVDLIGEANSEALADLWALESDHVRVILVPTEYSTANGTERKARANCYAVDMRYREGENRRNIWILHMDDDTGVGEDTMREIARMIRRNPPESPASRHFAQGVLTYPRQFAVNIWTWLADAVRPSSDLSIFRQMTGSGQPLIGAHGEFLLVRSSIEDKVGWDFGRYLSITEDAYFAIKFASQYPGRSEWLAARCYGASPATMSDLIVQRKRWARGLLHVARDRDLPLKSRMLMRYAMFSWMVGVFQHVIPVLLVAGLTSEFNTSPLMQGFSLAWALNMAVGVWFYVEGLRANAHASGMRRPALCHYFGLLLIPFFSLIEGIGGIKGFAAFLNDRFGPEGSVEDLFDVIDKPCPTPELAVV